MRFQSDLFALASVVVLILQDSIYLFTLFDKLTIIDYFKMPPSVKSSNFRKTIFIHAFFRILFWALLPLGSRQVLRARRDETVESAVISQKAAQFLQAVHGWHLISSFVHYLVLT